MDKLFSKLKATNFAYTGSNFTENEIIAKGYLQLSGEELLSKISNKTVFGDYPMGFKFIADIYENGKVEGVNHVGSNDFGNWMIDMEEHALNLHWNNSWINTLTRAYNVNGNIEFYDVDTGNWRTTFKIFESLK